MTKDIAIRNCTLDEFSKMFGTRKDYEKLIQEMHLKERILDPKPTNELENNLKKSLINKATFKKAASSLNVTSYSVKKDDDRNIVYISFAGGGQRILGVGRNNDIGGFFEAIESGKDLKVRIKTRYEYYKTWYALAVIIGFLFFIIPGAFMVVYFFIYHLLISNKINKNIVPVIINTFES
jgi:hypothetical protein